MEKTYTPLRQFYAIVGFSVIVVAVTYGLYLVAFRGLTYEGIPVIAEDGSVITDPAMYYGETSNNSYNVQTN